MNEMVKERWELVSQRIREIPGEKAAPELYREYFDSIACFLYQVGQIAAEEEPGRGLSLELLQKRCDSLYGDILPGQYDHSFMPSFADRYRWPMKNAGESLRRFLNCLWRFIRILRTKSRQSRSMYGRLFIGITMITAKIWWNDGCANRWTPLFLLPRILL